MNNIENSRAKLTTAIANLSTRAIVVTSAQGVPDYWLIQFSFRFLRWTSPRERGERCQHRGARTEWQMLRRPLMLLHNKLYPER